MTLGSSLMAVSDYLPAVFGLLGTLVGGATAGFFTLRVAREARDAAERSWMRDSRREIYDRFLTNAQKLLIACEASSSLGESRGSDEAGEAVKLAHVNFFEVYGVIQTVAERPVVDAARVYAYRLLELSTNRLGDATLERVAQLVRLARHDTIDAMRRELGLTGSARPPDRFNPFAGTELEHQFTLR